MRPSSTIAAGTFSGAEIENGTFHSFDVPNKSEHVNQRVTDAANGHARMQIGSAPAGTAACIWVPTPDVEEVPSARR